jgi:hypothetical protein
VSPEERSAKHPSPAEQPEPSKVETITLIPYGATTLRVSAFYWIR